MDYSYEILKYEPENLFIQVKYSADGKPDVFRNIVVKPFTQDEIDRYIDLNGQYAVKTWGYIDAVDPNMPAPPTTGTKTFTQKTIVNEPVPAYDEITQKLEQTYTETDTQCINGWTVLPMTAQEQADYLVFWRGNVQSTMRQARLALKQQGLLATVQSNIDALPEESQIEWEYAAVVERKSPLVASLGAALGLTETELDDLFKLALTL